MRRHAILPSVLLIASLAACSGSFFGAPENSPESGAGVASTGTLLQETVATLEPGPEAAAYIEALRLGIRGARDEERVALRAHRGALLADLLVMARAYRDHAPTLAEWYLDAAGEVFGVSPYSSSFPTEAVERIRADLSHLGAEARGDAVGAARWVLGLSEAPPSRTGSRGAVLHALDAFDGLSAWLRYGDDVDGGAYSSRVAAFASTGPTDGVPGVPQQVGTGPNATAIAALRTLVDTLASVRAVEHPLVDALEGHFAAVGADLESGWFPLAIPSTLVTEDARIRPPASFMPPPPEAGRGLGFTFRRVVVVRTDAVVGLLAPHVGVSDDEVVAREVAGGWAYPGSEIVRFDGFGAVGADALEGDTLPAMVGALGELEEWLDENAPLPPEERFTASSSPGISLIADGDLYYSSLRPVLGSLLSVGYSPIALHTLHRSTGALDAVAVRLVYTPAESDNLLIVREDGYLLQVWDPENLTPPVRIARTDEAPALAVHRALREGFASGALDASRPLTIRVDDNSVDFGILAHLLSAVSFERDLDGVERDPDLLRAPIVRVADGEPQVLCPAGLRLAL